MILATRRLTLRPFTGDDHSAFAAMNADPMVMADMGGPLTRRESDLKLMRYAQTFEDFGYGRLVVERRNESGEPAFLGYVGVMPVRVEHPLGDHDEIGWRMNTSAWGHGYATEAARAALDDAFHRAGLSTILSYTAPDNHRSQAVMERLALRRDASLDFSATFDKVGRWQAMVWVADRPE